MEDRDGIDALTEAIGRYNEAWNAQNLDAIVAMDAPDMVFANHTADVIPFDENGLIERKDVYSDSVSILRQVGLLD